MGKKITYRYTEKDIMNHLYEINNGDHDKFMKKILLIRNNIIDTDDDILKYVAKSTNNASLCRWLMLLENHYNIEYKSPYELFKIEYDKLIHELYSSLFNKPIDICRAIDNIYDNNSYINVRISQLNNVDSMVAIKLFELHHNNDTEYNTVLAYCHVLKNIINSINDVVDIGILHYIDTPSSKLLSHANTFNHIKYLIDREFE